MPAMSGCRMGLVFVAASTCLAGAMAASERASAASLPGVQLTQQNLVPDCASTGNLMGFLRSHNPQLDSRFAKIADSYVKYGQRYGVRWDVAFLQMMVTTGNLTFRGPNGSPGNVSISQNNFAGIGTLNPEHPGEAFTSIDYGVRAHIEHVLHYAGAAIQMPIAERTRKIQMWRVLENWHKGFDQPITYSDLAMKWAPHAGTYLKNIEELADAFQRQYCDGQPLLLKRIGRRPPQIAETAWHFEKLEGKPGTVGVTPPTGRPDFTTKREALGVGLPPPPTRASTSSRPITASVTTLRAPAPVQNGSSQRSSGAGTPKPQPHISVDDKIRQMLSDRKILLRTHVGAVIPILYDGNGKMAGEAGNLGFFLGASRDKGKWWVAKGKLCQKWNIWLDRETHCMKLKERGGTIWWRADDGNTGTAQIVSR